MIYKLTEDDIKEINNSEGFDSWYQGIFKEPNGVPDTMKDTCIYMRWNTGGVSGGSCWDSSNPQPYEGEDEPDFIVLEKALQKIVPTLSFLHFKEIERAIVSTEDSEYNYYGNHDDYEIKYLPLPVLYTLLEKLGY
jgi:hypothetical protein